MIVQIAEGLGNQMFCYAAGRALALKHEVPLYLDVHSQFRINKYKRKYLLGNYQIAGKELGVLPSLLGSAGHLLWKSGLLRKISVLPFVGEATLSLDERLLTMTVDGPRYLLGYWQHEEYFRDYRDVLLKEFERKNDPSRESVRISHAMEDCESVSVHVRSYKEVNGHIEFPYDYYRKAFTYMAERVDDPRFYVFTDDHAWVAEHLNLDYPITFVTCNSRRGYEGAMDDLWLMNRCRHHILWSSSFSWWGAWQACTDGLKVAPLQSLMGNLKSFPSHWVLL